MLGLSNAFGSMWNWGNEMAHAFWIVDKKAQLSLLANAPGDDDEPNTVIDAGEVGDTTLDLPTPTSTLPGGFDPDVLAFFFPEDGDAVARIEIPSIGVDKIVVNGVQVADLRKGPGHYPATALPGASGNSGSPQRIRTCDS